MNNVVFLFEPVNLINYLAYQSNSYCLLKIKNRTIKTLRKKINYKSIYLALLIFFSKYNKILGWIRFHSRYRWVRLRRYSRRTNAWGDRVLIFDLNYFGPKRNSGKVCCFTAMTIIFWSLKPVFPSKKFFSGFVWFPVVPGSDFMIIDRKMSEILIFEKY